MATTINLTPTWGDIGLLAYRLAVSNEEKALAHLRPDFARAFAMAEALKQLMPTLRMTSKASQAAFWLLN
ncbi:hypothetical protein Dsui_2600 [Azospira oryzae PS]|uniref:Uncharacterized protein n=1 Tax=Azospira oryzae (strain ATCC BAA-33 / DSM 13638 / PS) TaxID=640081 RepID=G8QNQ7_AZOOP|nr:hypothetical protein [Azospira oryzae]AEV26951.1 hypothetical protein Dsui_2600 [Azospira oryzae PS]